MYDGINKTIVFLKHYAVANTDRRTCLLAVNHFSQIYLRLPIPKALSCKNKENMLLR